MEDNYFTMWLFVSIWVFILVYYASINFVYAIVGEMIFQTAICGIALFFQEQECKRWKYG